MINRIKQNIFPSIIALSALSVSASAAFYSVSGLSKLFAGATFEVIIMAGSLEVAKLVIASLLYQYWDTINKILRTYLSIACIILVLITSMGIYGFLSAAYQETYQKLIVNENRIEFLENKAKFYEDDVTRYDQELERISNNISTLSNARATSIQVRDTSVVGGIRSTVSTAELRLAQSRIEAEEVNRNAVNEKRTVAADSLQTIKLDILSLQNNADTVGELGPLQYLSGLTGTPMDKIINILLLIIIFVFDPLAISLVVAANFAFDKARPKKNLYGERVWDEDDYKEYEITTYDGLEDEPESEFTTTEEIEKEPLDDTEHLTSSEKNKQRIEDSINDLKRSSTYNQDTIPYISGQELINNIETVIQKTPSRWKVLLKTGKVAWVDKTEAQRHITNDPNDPKNYM